MKKMENLLSTHTVILFFGSVILLLVGGGVLVSYIYFPKKTENRSSTEIASKNTISSQTIASKTIIDVVKDDSTVGVLQKPQSKNYVYTSLSPIFYFTQKIADGGLEVVDISKFNNEKVMKLSKNDFVLIDNAKAIIVDNKLPNQWITDYYIDPNKKLDLGASSLGTKNDYFWLNFESLKVNLVKIKEFIVQKDPLNKIIYEKNYDRLLLKLDGMIQKYNKKLSNCSTKTLIENGSTFENLSSQFGLEYLSINNSNLIKVNKDEEKRIKEILLKNKVKTLFVVGEYSDAELNVISTVLENIEIIKLDNFLENKYGQDYFDVLDNNLTSLADGLGCI
jgi:ABC-type Zn uptake system ZnuABC Zn-binding protein ZnuA